MTKARTYYTLATREYEGAPWAPQFGDYSRGCVEYELDDYRDQGYERKDLKIIKSMDDQASINAAVEALNA